MTSELALRRVDLCDLHKFAYLKGASGRFGELQKPTAKTCNSEQGLAKSLVIFPCVSA